MSFDPTVSVVLPVWNAERFLAQAIESVLRQTFRSFELIVIDDGSTDRSGEIADGFARASPQVVTLHTEHRGIAHALNTGVAAAHSSYVARMDADDISDPSRLEKQIAFLEAHPECVAVGANVDVIDDDGEVIGAMRFPATHAGIVQALISGASPAVAHPAMVMRKSAVLAAGGYREEHVPSEDLDLWLRLIEFGEMANLSEPLLQYRRHLGATGIRDGGRQRATTAIVRAAARARRGLPSLHSSFGGTEQRNAVASFHYECVRAALSSGNRAAVIKHAQASIRHAPGWWRPYAALAVSALPKRGLHFFMRTYVRLRS